MPDDPNAPPKPPRLSDVPNTDDFVDDEDEDLGDIGYRSRGRPKLPPEQRRREKIVVAVTEEELRLCLIAGANSPGGPKRVQDWVRKLILDALKAEEKK